MYEDLNIYFKNTDCKASVGRMNREQQKWYSRILSDTLQKEKINRQVGPHGLIMGHKPLTLWPEP